MVRTFTMLLLLCLGLSLTAQTAKKPLPKTTVKATVKTAAKPLAPAPMPAPELLPPPVPTLPPMLVLEPGTQVILETHIELDSKFLKEGEEVCLHLKYPIQVAGQTLISAGREAYCRINRLIRPRSGGQPGSIELEPLYVKANDGQYVSLSGNSLLAMGRDREGLAQLAGAGTGALGAQLGNMYAQKVQAQQMDIQNRMLSQQQYDQMLREQQLEMQRQDQVLMQQQQNQQAQLLQQQQMDLLQRQQALLQQQQMAQMRPMYPPPTQMVQRRPQMPAPQTFGQDQLPPNLIPISPEQAAQLSQAQNQPPMNQTFGYSAAGTQVATGLSAMSNSPVVGAVSAGLLHVSSVLNVVSPLITLLIKGKRAVVPEGYTMRAFVAQGVVMEWK